VAPANDQSQCTPTCNSGFTGSLSATCNTGSWTTSGTCSAQPCASLPSITNSGAGNCVSGAASGTTCTPQCNSGFSGTLSATCTQGAWSTTGACGAVGGSPCATLPSVQNAGVGNCMTNTASGSSCNPTCNSGFTGTPTATCSNGAWVVSGSCIDTNCAGLPNIPNSGAGNCVANSADTTTCTPQCSFGFSGTLSATCTTGTWVSTGSCAGSLCATLPSIQNSGQGDCVVNSPDGTACTPLCSTGFSGTLTATCQSGIWSTTGSCSGTSCPSIPDMPNAGPGNCVSNPPDGTSCQPQCNPGFNGVLSADCASGIWSTTGICTTTSCTSLPSIPNSSPGDCLAGAVTQSSCTPVCSTGFNGTLSATCMGGSWDTFGSCTNVSAICTGMPNITNSGPGNCSSNVPNLFSCAPVCNPGWKGDLSAWCNVQAWQLSGSCVSASTGGGLSTGAIVGIIVAAIVCALLVLGAGVWFLNSKTDAFEVV